jgi:hypothetical protein
MEADAIICAIGQQVDACARKSTAALGVDDAPVKKAKRKA